MQGQQRLPMISTTKETVQDGLQRNTAGIMGNDEITHPVHLSLRLHLRDPDRVLVFVSGREKRDRGGS